MNVSGRAVQAMAAFYKIDPDDILVVHDELDLPPGTARLKKGGGVAGHNGLKDIAAKLGPDFWRLRIGIGHPGDKNEVVDYVLHPPRAGGAKLISDAIERSLEVWPLIFAGEMEKAMHRLHTQDRDRDSSALAESAAITTYLTKSVAAQPFVNARSRITSHESRIDT